MIIQINNRIRSTLNCCKKLEKCFTFRKHYIILSSLVMLVMLHSGRSSNWFLIIFSRVIFTDIYSRRERAKGTQLAEVDEGAVRQAQLPSRPLFMMKAQGTVKTFLWPSTVPILERHYEGLCRQTVSSTRDYGQLCETDSNNFLMTFLRSQLQLPLK